MSAEFKVESSKFKEKAVRAAGIEQSETILRIQGVGTLRIAFIYHL
jgi:hypothetical protein